MYKTGTSTLLSARSLGLRHNLNPQNLSSHRLHQIRNMAAKSTQQLFLSSEHFAVVGASKDQSKYGTKVLQWYQVRNKDVTPVHPKETELEGITAVRSIADLVSPSTTSISIITPPKEYLHLRKITLGILEKAKELSVPALWLQPGAEDEAVIAYIRENDLEDRVIFGGPCILVQGDGVLRSLL